MPRRVSGSMGARAGNDQRLRAHRGHGVCSDEYATGTRVGGGPDWTNLRGMYVLPGVEDAPSTLVWMGKNSIQQAPLIEVPEDEAGPSSRPSAGASATPSDGAADESSEPTPEP